MDLSDLNASFNEQTEPQDGGLLELLRLDYNSYYLYKELGAEKVPCVVLDAQADAPSVEYISEPYYLEPPSVEII
jgi:hypothetical protein